MVVVGGAGFFGGRLVRGLLATTDLPVIVAGRDTGTHRPRELADVVGVVGQNPVAGFVTDTVETELAYGMEQLALPAATMRKRVEETLDLLGIADLRDAVGLGPHDRHSDGLVPGEHEVGVVLGEGVVDEVGCEAPDVGLVDAQHMTQVGVVTVDLED